MASQELVDDLSKSATGFLSKEDYKRKREDLEQEKALKALKARVADGGSSSGVAAEPSSEGKSKKEKKKDKKKAPAALSFGDELDGEGEASPSVQGGMAAARAKEKQAAADKQEAAMREILAQQRQAREEPLTLSYTFRSAITQRELPNAVLKGTVQVKRGFTSEEAAVAVRTDVEKLGGKFKPNEVQGIREERDVVLVVCCEGSPQGSFLIPGAVNLVELATRKWADTGVSIFDDFAHGIHVTERRYFEAQCARLPNSNAACSDHTPGRPP